MRIYYLDADVNNFQSVYLVSEEISEITRMFDGRPISLNWKAPEVKLSGERRLPIGDFPGLATNIPVFSQNAVDALRYLLEPHGEVLPLRSDEGQYAAFNVTTVIDALDEQHSDVKRFSNGHIMRIIRAEFHSSMLKGIHIFKLPQFLLSKPCVSDEFVQRVKSMQLKGFDFQLVWEDE